MSRAYRVRQTIRVQDCLTRDVETGDEITTALEFLDILPPAETQALLEQELRAQGYEEVEGQLERREGDIRIRVDPRTAQVTITIQGNETVVVEGVKEERTVLPVTESQRRALRETLRQELQEQLQEQTHAVERKVSAELEAKLGDLTAELDAVVTRVTAEALKQKAAQIGTIREIVEDTEMGTLTIKLDV